MRYVALVALVACATDPAPITGTAIAITTFPDRLLVTVNIGTDQGVTSAATCAYVDTAGPVVSTDCAIERVDAHTTNVTSRSLQMDDVKIHPVVRFTNP